MKYLNLKVYLAWKKIMLLYNYTKMFIQRIL